MNEKLEAHQVWVPDPRKSKAKAREIGSLCPNVCWRYAGATGAYQLDLVTTFERWIVRTCAVLQEKK